MVRFAPNNLSLIFWRKYIMTKKLIDMTENEFDIDYSVLTRKQLDEVADYLNVDISEAADNDDAAILIINHVTDECEVRDALFSIGVTDTDPCFIIKAARKSKPKVAAKKPEAAKKVDEVEDVEFTEWPRPEVSALTKPKQQQQKVSPVTAAIETVVKASEKETAEALIQALNKALNPTVDYEALKGQINNFVQSSVKEAVSGIVAPTVVEVKRYDEKKLVKLGASHYNLPKLIRFCEARDHAGYRLNVFLVGGAGTGKTTAAHQVSEALGLNFYFNGAIGTKYELQGFIDAQGRIISTAFRKAYEFGGVYLFDEVDGSLPQATLAFNAALANGECDFPDGTVKRHKDFVCIAAANTYGMGATFDYVGRNKQDAAFLNRFVTLAWDTDEKLEFSFCPNHEDWVRYVQKVRKNVAAKGLKIIVSPRASIYGAALIDQGFSFEEAATATIRTGVSEEQWNLIK
jgi:hypothetical protein